MHGKENLCGSTLEKLLQENKLWGEADQNYRAGVSARKNVPLKILISQSKTAEGVFEIVLENGSPRPVITLSMHYSVPEILITLNHELVHFSNSSALLELISAKGQTAGVCASPYALSVLKDENRAFHSEVIFWNKSPQWFQKLFAEIPFRSKFSHSTEKSFDSYYRNLERSLKHDPLYASKRYIALKKYPPCALKLIQEKN